MTKRAPWKRVGSETAIVLSKWKVEQLLRMFDRLYQL